MKRALTRIVRIAEKRNDDYVPGSLGKRLRMVWPLTKEVASLSKIHDVERRLQRDVAVLGRRGR